MSLCKSMLALRTVILDFVLVMLYNESLTLCIHVFDTCIDTF